MKALLISFLLLLGVVTGLGAPNNPKIIIKSVQPANYDYNFETHVYNSLGFGGTDAMLQFMTNQVMFLAIDTYQEDGSSNGNDDPFIIYKGYNHPEFRGTETFEEFFYRVSNTEFQRAVQANGFRVNQKFTLKYIFYGQSGVVVQFTARVTFTPVNLGSAYVLPIGTYEELKMFVFTPKELIWWPGIVKASMVVFDKKGQLIFNGTDNLADPGFDLEIPRAFMTNGCTGTITITMDNDTSVMYDVSDGHLISDPQSVKPLLGLTVAKGGQVKVTVGGGAPYQGIILQCYSALGTIPHKESLTLDRLGAVAWTNTSSLPVRFFKLSYGYGD